MAAPKSKDAFFILFVIFILVGLAWDPIRNGALSNPVLTSNSGSSTYVSPSDPYTYPSDPYTSPTSPTTPVSEKDVSEQIRLTEQTAENLRRNLELEAEKKNRSPYYGKITFSYIASLNDPNPSSEYITLYASLNKGEKVNITGWKFMSEKSSNWAKIGKASVLPFPFSTQTDDVVLQPGDIAYIIKGFSPIGISFRSNVCTGYFGENRTFYPYLNRTCPLPENEPLPQFSTVLDREDECLDLIERLPMCTTASKYTNLNRLPDTISSSCKEYLETKVNYNTCVANHFGDTNFPGHEWYVYMNVFGPLWSSKREKITLYDNNNLIVATISY